ncbi:MAG: chloramphenicol acetyltransferase [Pyrinomonadaceae bacterium]|nr:chloramphenicol acetyltransferase [Pyrinomonadaceae bacterium]
MPKPVDLENWNRRDAYEFFRSYDDPFFNVTVSLDATELLNHCKENGYSFSAACIYFSTRSANDIREFRIRIVGDELIEYDLVEATQTLLMDDDSFKFCYFPMCETLEEFDRSAVKAVDKYKKLKTFDVESDRLDLIYYSVLPWLPFTSFKHASKFDRLQTVPRIVFGKYGVTGGQHMIPVSVEVNHMIMDGIHVGQYVDRLQKYFDTCGVC